MAPSPSLGLGEAPNLERNNARTSQWQRSLRDFMRNDGRLNDVVAMFAQKFVQVGDGPQFTVTTLSDMAWALLVVVRQAALDGDFPLETESLGYRDQYHVLVQQSNKWRTDCLNEVSYLRDIKRKTWDSDMQATLEEIMKRDIYRFCPEDALDSETRKYFKAAMEENMKVALSQGAAHGAASIERADDLATRMAQMEEDLQEKAESLSVLADDNETLTRQLEETRAQLHSRPRPNAAGAAGQKESDQESNMDRRKAIRRGKLDEVLADMGMDLGDESLDPSELRRRLEQLESLRELLRGLGVDPDDQCLTLAELRVHLERLLGAPVDTAELEGGKADVAELEMLRAELQAIRLERELSPQSKSDAAEADRLNEELETLRQQLHSKELKSDSVLAMEGSAELDGLQEEAMRLREEVRNLTRRQQTDLSELDRLNDEADKLREEVKHLRHKKRQVEKPPSEPNAEKRLREELDLAQIAAGELETKKEEVETLREALKNLSTQRQADAAELDRFAKEADTLRQDMWELKQKQTTTESADAKEVERLRQELDSLRAELAAPVDATELDSLRIEVKMLRQSHESSAALGDIGKLKKEMQDMEVRANIAEEEVVRVREGLERQSEALCSLQGAMDEQEVMGRKLADALEAEQLGKRQLEVALTELRQKIELLKAKLQEKGIDSAVIEEAIGDIGLDVVLPAGPVCVFDRLYRDAVSRFSNRADLREQREQRRKAAGGRGSLFRGAALAAMIGQRAVAGTCAPDDVDAIDHPGAIISGLESCNLSLPSGPTAPDAAAGALPGVALVASPVASQTVSPVWCPHCGRCITEAAPSPLLSPAGSRPSSRGRLGPVNQDARGRLGPVCQEQDLAPHRRCTTQALSDDAADWLGETEAVTTSATASRRSRAVPSRQVVSIPYKPRHHTLHSEEDLLLAILPLAGKRTSGVVALGTAEQRPEACALRNRPSSGPAGCGRVSPDYSPAPCQREPPPSPDPIPSQEKAVALIVDGGAVVQKELDGIPRMSKMHELKCRPWSGDFRDRQPTELAPAIQVYDWASLPGAVSAAERAGRASRTKPAQPRVLMGLDLEAPTGSRSPSPQQATPTVLQAPAFPPLKMAQKSASETTLRPREASLDCQDRGRHRLNFRPFPPLQASAAQRVLEDSNRSPSLASLAAASQHGRMLQSRGGSDVKTADSVSDSRPGSAAAIARPRHTSTKGSWLPQQDLQDEADLKGIRPCAPPRKPRRGPDGVFSDCENQRTRVVSKMKPSE